jgi:hypothetical protein
MLRIAVAGRTEETAAWGGLGVGHLSQTQRPRDLIADVLHSSDRLLLTFVHSSLSANGVSTQRTYWANG